MNQTLNRVAGRLGGSALLPTGAAVTAGTFCYNEAWPQFERVLEIDPACAMAHWGIAMSVFHQLWDRPDDASLGLGWGERQAPHAAHMPGHNEHGAVDHLAAPSGDRAN